MPRTIQLFLPVLCLALLATPAVADGRVPAIAAQDLPVAGTCAPIETRDVTHVRVGATTDLRWFAVAGQAQVVDYPGLVALLKSRAGTARPSTHGVWITATAKHPWVHVLLVRKAALEAGLYRVGLRVRSQTTGQVLGFPLFVPPTKTGRTGPKAGILSLRIQGLHPREAKAPSDVRHAYAAARRALAKRADFGVEKIVADLRIATNAPLQYALSAIDLLYRAGCSGVRVPLSLRMTLKGLEVVPKLEIQGGVASRLKPSITAPPIRPRTKPWSILGAAEAGWVDFEMTALPSIDALPTKKGSAKVTPRPNYAADPAGVPGTVWRSVDAEARTWMQKLGADLLAGVRRQSTLEKRFAIGLRRKEVLPNYVTPAQRAFPDATSVIPSTVLFNTLLFHRDRLVARADITLMVTGDRMRLIFGTWSPAGGTTPGTLVPFAVDPFAGGDGAAFRIWFEALYGAMKKYGLRALPTADAKTVLPYFPSVAHRGVAAAIAKRDPDLQRIAAGLAATTWDRVVLSVSRGTATVLKDRSVIGILNFSLRAEEGELRLNDLKARRPR